MSGYACLAYAAKRRWLMKADLMSIMEAGRRKRKLAGRRRRYIATPR
jgi:hypothetical protein